MTKYEQAILKIAEQDERLIILTSENRAPIRSLPELLGNRFVDVGIAEQTMVGMAAGLALRGRRPIIHGLAAFLTMRAFEFIRTDIGIPKLPVVLVGYVPGFLSDGNGPTHQALEDISLMRGIPGMNVFCPADHNELAEALPFLIKTNDPWYVRYVVAPRSVPRIENGFSLERAELIKEGNDISILTYGPLLKMIWNAIPSIEREGSCSVRVINMRTLKPYDRTMIDYCLKTSRLVVTIEDHFRSGGLATIVDECFRNSADKISLASSLPQILSISMEERWFVPALINDVLVHEQFTPKSLSARILQCFNQEVRYAEQN